MSVGGGVFGNELLLNSVRSWSKIFGINIKLEYFILIYIFTYFTQNVSPSDFSKAIARFDKFNRFLSIHSSLLFLCDCTRGRVATRQAWSAHGERFDSHCGQFFKSGKSECNNSGYKLTGLTWWP